MNKRKNGTREREREIQRKELRTFWGYNMSFFFLPSFETGNRPAKSEYGYMYVQ